MRCVCEAVSLLLKSTVREPLHVNELLHKNMTKMMFTPTFVDIKPTVRAPLHVNELLHKNITKMFTPTFVDIKPVCAPLHVN